MRKKQEGISERDLSSWVASAAAAKEEEEEEEGRPLSTPQSLWAKEEWGRSGLGWVGGSAQKHMHPKHTHALSHTHG